jgi:hypothetical protein
MMSEVAPALDARSLARLAGLGSRVAPGVIARLGARVRA